MYETLSWKPFSCHVWVKIFVEFGYGVFRNISGQMRELFIVFWHFHSSLLRMCGIKARKHPNRGLHDDSTSMTDGWCIHLRPHVILWYHYAGQPRIFYHHDDSVNWGVLLHHCHTGGGGGGIYFLCVWIAIISSIGRKWIRGMPVLAHEPDRTKAVDMEAN